MNLRYLKATAEKSVDDARKRAPDLRNAWRVAKLEQINRLLEIAKQGEWDNYEALYAMDLILAKRQKKMVVIFMLLSLRNFGIAAVIAYVIARVLGIWPW